MRPFEQMVNAWIAAPNAKVREIKKNKFSPSPLEKRLLQLLRDKTCPIKGMTTMQAARALGMGVGALRLPIKHLRMYDLIYSKPTPKRGVQKLWIAY